MKKLLITLSVLCLCFVCIMIYSSTLALTNVNFVNTTIQSTKIPTSFNGIKIVYFSDLLFGEFMDEKRLNQMINEINNCDGDIIIFGGDLISNKLDLKSLNKNKLIKSLAKIDAPLGKFAVLGDNDCKSDEAKKIVNDILYKADFEVLNNTSLNLHNKNKDSITIIGLENILNGNKNYAKALQNINTKNYNILISHCPDMIKSKEINPAHLDMVLSGHSLGGQMYIPLISMFQEIKGASEYYRGSYYLNDCKMIVSNGLGTTNNDIRLFTPPQIHVFHLQSEKVEKQEKVEKENEKKEEKKTQDENKQSVED